MSDEKQETLADIVADIRERAENAMRNGERLVHNEAVAMLLRSIADRLEAAAKRDEERAVEHATRHAEAVARDNCRDCVHNPRGRNYEGNNAAAMHEVLVKIRRELNDYCNGSTLLDRMTEDPPDYTCLRDSLLEIERIVDAALSVPPRNCDRFADELDAQLAFLNEVWLISVDREEILERDKYENWTDEMRKRYGRWLLASAERKGEGDGR